MHEFSATHLFHHFQNSDESSSLVLLIFYAHLLWLKIALLMANSSSLPPLHKFGGKKGPQSSIHLKNASEIWLNDFTVRSPSLTATVRQICSTLAGNLIELCCQIAVKQPALVGLPERIPARWNQQVATWQAIDKAEV